MATCWKLQNLVLARVLRLLESEQRLSGRSFPARKAITGACYMTGAHVPLSKQMVKARHDSWTGRITAPACTFWVSANDGLHGLVSSPQHQCEKLMKQWTGLYPYTGAPQPMAKKQDANYITEVFLILNREKTTKQERHQSSWVRHSAGPLCQAANSMGIVWV
jgi:hypothetical protein